MLLLSCANIAINFYAKVILYFFFLSMTNLSTNSIHGADHLARVPDVIPPINITTTFRYSNNPEELTKAVDIDQNKSNDNYVYSRISHPNALMLEETLAKMTGYNAVCYSSGLAAFFASITYFNPKVVSIGQGYHGCHGILDIFKKNNGLEIIGLEDNLDRLNKGDIIHLETPVNPDGTNFNIRHFADMAHKRGALLMVDATLAPPPLMDPFAYGADIVIHSATKYFGGHSDLLAGITLTKDANIGKELRSQRLFIGTNISSLEASLLLRSLKTFELRILKQSENASKIVKFLHDNILKYPIMTKISHGSLQNDEYIKYQMPNGHSPVFSIVFSDENVAKSFPSKLKYFLHATSLGGVESLVEWRAMSDKSVDPCLLRFSVGVEDVEDLIDDLENAMK